MTPQKRKRLLTLLSELYPNPSSELHFKNDYQLIIAVVLSAQCTDKKVNQVTPSLFKRYRNFKELSLAKEKDVEEIIREVNYYKTKSKNIVQLAKRIMENFNGTLPTEHDDLISLHGVGRKTANVIQCEKGIRPAMPVDTHVLRVSNRLGLSSAKTPEGVEGDLTKQFPADSWRDLHHQLIYHGRRVCKARNPLCDECKLCKICPSCNINN
ncbi:MAG: endonuclease III [Bdellovibrionota bacterium]|jgi:endonuclease-3